MPSVELDKILERAIERVKKKWWRAALVNLLGMGIYFIVGVIALLIGVLITLLFKIIFSSLTLGIILGSIIFLIFMMWTSSWISLASLKIITENENIGAFQAFSMVKDLAFSYTIFSLFKTLFLLGLLPYFIIPWIVWSFWGIFASYVFLFEPETRKGLKPIWRSRELIKGNGWKVFFLILLFVGIEVLGLFFSLSKSNSLSLVWWLFTFLFLNPFSLSSYYEMFEELRKGKETIEAKRANTSFVLSVIGMIIIVGLVIVSLKSLSTSISNFQWKKTIEKFYDKKIELDQKTPSI